MRRSTGYGRAWEHLGEQESRGDSKNSHSRTGARTGALKNSEYRIEHYGQYIGAFRAGDDQELRALGRTRAPKLAPLATVVS